MSEQWFEFDKRVWPVNEGYFGETEGIRKILDQLGKLREKYASQPYNYNIGIEKDPGYTRLCKLFCEEFGFNDFALYIVKSVRQNAFTYPIGTSWDQPNVKSLIEITPTGYRYKKPNTFLCWICIFGGFFYNVQRFTHREILAIILHEVGHNFSPKVPFINATRTLGCAAAVMTAIAIGSMCAPVGIAILLLSSSQLRKFEVFIDRYIQEHFPNLSDCLKVISYYLNWYSDIVGEVQFIKSLTTMFALPFHTVDIILGRIWRYISNLIHAPGNVFFLVSGYGDEQFADAFPTLYGLGPDLASALDKLSGMKEGLVSQEYVADELPLIAAMRDICTLPIALVLTPLDMHPAIFERIKNTQRILEEEADNCGNPRLKKRIVEDNKNLTKYLNTYYNVNHNYLEDMYKKKGDRLARDDYFSRNYYALILHMLGGDLRHHIADKIYNVRGAISSKRDREEKKKS